MPNYPSKKILTLTFNEGVRCFFLKHTFVHKENNNWECHRLNLVVSKIEKFKN